MSRASILFLIGFMACRGGESATAPDATLDLARGSSRPTSGIIVTDLGLSGAREDSYAEDIDDQGRIVGWRGPWSGPNRAFLWTPTSPRATTGTAVDLGDLGGGAAEARGINGSGQIVGSSTTAAAAQHAFLWEGGTMHELLAAAGLTWVIAFDLNDAPARLVVGGEQILEQALVWAVSGSGAGFQAAPAVALPDLSSPSLGSFAFAVNDGGTVVGYSNVASASLANRPVKWANSGAGWAVTALQLPANTLGGVARDINSSGKIVGEVALPGGNCTQAVAWEPPASAPAILPMLKGGSCAYAFAVNDAGQVSGTATDARGSTRAVLWKPLASGGYSVADLGRLVGTTPFILGMNEPRLNASGLSEVEVVGTSQFSGGAVHATLWTVR
jgi:probable HAF family extracellular repeat protein